MAELVDAQDLKSCVLQRACEFESRSRHISQVFSGADPRWREIVGYGKGHVWLKVDA